MREYLYVGLATFAMGLIVGAATERTAITRDSNRQMTRDIREAEHEIELLKQIAERIHRVDTERPLLQSTEILL